MEQWLMRSQPRLHPPRWSDPQVRPQHLPSVLQGEVRRHRFRQGTTTPTRRERDARRKTCATRGPSPKTLQEPLAILTPGQHR
jgi:hypothetical protein